MIDFIFHNPCKVFFGKTALSYLGDEVKTYGSNVLLVYGGGSVKKIGLYDDIMRILQENAVNVWELSGIVPNPVLSRVYEGILLCRKHKIDLVLAVGGGSVIDTAKGIVCGVPYDGDVWDFFAGKAIPKKTLPLGTVLTIPAAGSEMSYSSVITNEESRIKCGFNAVANVPTFSLLNPEYSYSLPAYQIACGCVDILAHLMERYFTQVPHVELTDRMLEACMRTLINNTPITMEKPDDYNARAEVMWTGCIAHNTLLQTGRVGDWASHKLSHELSALYDLAHGAGLAIVFPAWMKYVLPHGIEKLKQFALRVWDVSERFGTDEEIVREGIRRYENFCRSLNLPTRLSEAGINSSRLEEMSNRFATGGPVGEFVPMNQKDALTIYRSVQ